MQFEYTPPQTEVEKIFGGHFSINLLGKIGPEDDQRFESFLTKSQPPPRTRVYVNSSGGDVEAAMGIGRSIRRERFSTSVGSYVLDHSSSSELIIPRQLIGGDCFSAATLVYLGGILRFFDEESKFGVHQFSFKNPMPDSLSRSQRLSAAIARYIEEMNIPAAFLEQSATTPGDDLAILSLEQMKNLKVITGFETDPIWGTEIQENIMWVRGERDSLYGHGKVMLCYSKPDGFLFVALVEAMGRVEELLNFGLVEIVANGEATRIDVSDRCMRSPSGIYIMFMVKVSTSEARILAYSDSFGIQVRGGPDAGVFLGISAMSTDGGKDKLRGLYELLRR